MQAILDCGWCRFGLLGFGSLVCVETVYFCFGPQINNTLDASLLRPASCEADCCIPLDGWNREKFLFLGSV